MQIQHLELVSLIMFLQSLNPKLNPKLNLRLNLRLNLTFLRRSRARKGMNPAGAYGASLICSTG